MKQLRINYGIALGGLFQFYILDRNTRLPGMLEDLSEDKLQNIKDRFYQYKGYTLCTFQTLIRRYTGLSINHNKIIPFNDIYHEIPYRNCIELPRIRTLNIGAIVILRNIQDINLLYLNNSIGVIVKNITIDNNYPIRILNSGLQQYKQTRGIQLSPDKAILYRREYEIQNDDNIMRIPELNLSANQLELL